MGAGVEKRLVLVRERNVDYDGRGEGQKSVSERGPEFPRIFCCKMFEAEGGIDALYRCKL